MNLREAAQQALEVLEDSHQNINPERRYADELTRQIADAITSLRAALAEATSQESRQVEPVGYFSINSYGNWEQNENDTGEPLYPAPPKRKPLTDEQIQKCVGEVDDARLAGPITKLIRAVERAHGIGGEE